MVTQKLLDLLLDDEAFAEIKNDIQSKGIQIHLLPRTAFDKVAEKICKRVTEVLKRRPELKDRVRNEKLTGSTLKSVFDPQTKLKSPEHGSREKTIDTLLVFVDIEEAEWPMYKNDTAINEKQLKFNKLIGYWYIYRFDHTYEERELKKTLLHIYLAENGYTLKASFKSLDDVYKNGEVKINDSFLTIAFKNDKKSIEISAAIDNKILNGDKVLNGILRSIMKGYPYAKHCIISYAANQELDFENDAQVITIPPFSTAGDKLLQEGEEVIYNYINRKAKRIKADPFNPASIKGIKKRNDDYLGHLKKFCKSYYVFIQNAYHKTANDLGSLLQLTIEINDAGVVTEKILLERENPDGDIIDYHGVATVLEDTLRLSNVNKYNQQSEYLFKISLSEYNPDVIEGITLDTDRSGFPCADACIAITKDYLEIKSKEIINTAFEFTPKKIQKGSDEYNAINSYLESSKIKTSIQKYFFEDHISIRYK